MAFKHERKPAEQRPSCLWTETSEDEGLWSTGCGCEIDERDRFAIRWEMDGEFCPWCGGRITEETMEERRIDDFAHLDGIRARKLDEDRGLA